MATFNTDYEIYFDSESIPEDVKNYIEGDLDYYFKALEKGNRAPMFSTG